MKTIKKGLMISAPRKSSGKTTLTLGVSSALVKQGTTLRVFKKGPDYIDPMWHKAATGKTCYNIDPYWMNDEVCRNIFLKHGAEVDLNLLEGNHGLHDGLDLTGNNSGAYLARLLDIPVLLIVDGAGMNRGVAAIVLGHQQLDTDVKIGGIVLNNVNSMRQINKQTAAIEHYCGIPVVGALPRSNSTGIKERHLGLVTIHETEKVKEVISSLGNLVAENCDLERIKAISGDIFPDNSYPDGISKLKTQKVKIGVAFDKAFCFYYPDNLKALEKAGAELVFFDTINDKHLPKVDAIYLGGGFPESFLQELENNKSIRNELLTEIEKGKPVYAECGGLMYLTRSIERNGIKKKMVGAISADVLFQKKPVGKGYTELATGSANGWFKINRIIKGHEFHYSRLINIEEGMKYCFKVQRGTGVDNKNDGIIYKNVLASYTHLHSVVVPEWAPAFVNAAQQNKNV